jgi:hypothetical protein
MTQVGAAEEHALNATIRSLREGPQGIEFASAHYS